MTLHSLPLFPLGTVFYPEGQLPLRIFEVRYLDMVNKCLGAGAPFGVVSLTEGIEVQRPNADEAFSSVGTLALISQHASPKAGLKVVVCTGGQRFRIMRRERLKHGLWIADVEHIQDDHTVEVPAELDLAPQALRKAQIQLLASCAIDSEHPLVKNPQFDICGWVANRWCELLPLRAELKQQLLELDSPIIRLELVHDILEKYKII